MTMNILPKLLVIEDDELTQQVVANAVQNEFEVRIHGSGEGVIELVDEFSPHVLLLDIGLPEISGLELCKHVKSWNDESIQVILFSAFTEDEDIRTGYMAMADDYVTKPFKPYELMHKLRVHARSSLRMRKLQSDISTLKTRVLDLKTALNLNRECSEKTHHPSPVEN